MFDKIYQKTKDVKHGNDFFQVENDSVIFFRKMVLISYEIQYLSVQ